MKNGGYFLLLFNTFIKDCTYPIEISKNEISEALPANVSLPIRINSMAIIKKHRPVFRDTLAEIENFLITAIQTIRATNSKNAQPKLVII